MYLLRTNCQHFDIYFSDFFHFTKELPDTQRDPEYPIVFLRFYRILIAREAMNSTTNYKRYSEAELIRNIAAESIQQFYRCVIC